MLLLLLIVHGPLATVDLDHHHIEHYQRLYSSQSRAAQGGETVIIIYINIILLISHSEQCFVEEILYIILRYTRADLPSS